MRAGKIPFAIGLTATIAAIAVATGAWLHPTASDVMEKFGYSTRDLWTGRFWTLLTAIFLTSRPAMTWIIIGFAPLSVGLYERLAGTKRALVVFFGGDVVATLSLSLLVIAPLRLSGSALGARWADERDVGMSAGGFCVLGAAIALAPKRWRYVLLAGVLALIGVKAAINAEPVADLVHVFGAVLGFGAQSWFGRTGIGNRE